MFGWRHDKLKNLNVVNDLAQQLYGFGASAATMLSAASTIEFGIEELAKWMIREKMVK